MNAEISKMKEYDRPLVVASHFGFVPIDSPKVTDADHKAAAGFGAHPHYSAAEKIAFLRHYQERRLHALPHPLGVAYKRGRNHSLELVGFPDGLAEAMLIRTSLSMLHEAGYKHLVVDINSIGDSDSVSAYEKELHNFLRRSGAELPAELKKEFRKDAFSIISHEHPKAAELRDSLPTSIAFLSARSRAYFKEVLEFVESRGVEFRLAPHLIGDKSFCSHTVFNIKRSDDGDAGALAVGYSYHRLGRRAGLKKDTPLSGATVFSSLALVKKERPYKDLPKPKFYLIQLGREAKMRSLSTLEHLRRERIAVHHVIGKDKLTAQLSEAENLGVPYLLIIGQKEALEDTVTVRNVSSRAQETVPVSALAKFLKSLHI